MRQRATSIRFAAAVALAALPWGPAMAQSGAGSSGVASSAPSALYNPPPVSRPARDLRPNVLVWMLDDVGFAQIASFGGLIDTPNIDRVAAMGLRYANYHTAPICSAARASFLSGRMPHSVNLGGHAAVARPIPGYSARIPASAGTIADNLGQAGYATYALGKWDHLLASESTPAGPFSQWPTGQGFDRFYGFLAADTDNFHPALVRDTTPVPTPSQPGYHLNRDLADQAIAMIADRRIADRPRPFLMYWATGTAHAPHHAPADWIARYAGKFDMGWDAVREAILARQKSLALLPAGARLAARPDGVPAWETLSPEERRLYAHQMEVFAASLSYADAQFGRILDALETAGELDNTIVIVVSDNGASAEGSRNGMWTEALLGRGRQASLDENLAFLDRWGGPESYPHYSMGWAVAGNTPYRYYKSMTYEGGSRVPLVIAWPRGIAARGELRGQYVHVSDVAPTILEAAGVPLAERVDNVEQTAMEGVSFAYSFDNAAAPTRKDAQYSEMFGNKGLWAQGWTIVTRHRTEPWDMTTARPVNEPWELYDLRNDPAQMNDLSGQQPERVADMNRIFEEQAVRFHVNPVGNIADGLAETARVARDSFARRVGVWRYSGPVGYIQQTVAPPVAAMGFSMNATLDLPRPDISGPVFAIGGQLGGMALYLRRGRPVFALNTLDGAATTIAGRDALPPGTVPISLHFDRTPDGADVTVSSGASILARGRVSAAMMRGFGVFEHFGVGIDSQTPVLADAPPDATFPGAIRDVSFDFNPTP